LLALVAIFPRPAPGDRSVEPAYRLGITVDPDGGVAIGDAQIALTNTTRRPLAEIVLRLLANHFRELPPGIGEANFHWVYPGDFDPGAIEIERVSGGGDHALRFELDRGGRVARVRLPSPLGPGERAVLQIRYRLRIPERLGRFGRAEGLVTLAGGAYPELALLTPSGFDERHAPARARFHVAVTVPEDHEVVLGDRLRRTSPAGAGWRLAEASLDAPYLLILAGPRLRASTRDGAVVIGPSEDALGEDAAPRPMSTASVPERTEGIDRERHVLASLARAASFWRSLGLPAPRAVAAIVPLRSRLASSSPGMVLVSDRAFELPPLDRTRKFHEIQILRAAFDTWARALFVSRESEEDLPWVADLVAVALAERYVKETYGGAEWAADVMGLLAVHPVVDQLLYAPSAPFVDAYFPFIEEPDALREEPERFLNDLPRGRRIVAKFRDLLGEARFEALIVRTLASMEPFRRSAAQAAGEDLAWFWRGWLGPYPSVAYGIGRIGPNQVTVARRGESIREPVTVEGRTAAGDVVRGTWDGRGDRGTVPLPAAAPIESAVVDPDFRLIEDPALGEDHPRFDNVWPVRWRPPLFNSLALDVSVSEARPTLTMDFAMRRLYDLTHVFGLRVDTGARGFGASVRYLRGFGYQRDTNARRWYAGPILGVTRWSGGFDVNSEPGITTSLLGAAVHDDRRAWWDPWKGTSFVIAGGPSFTRLDASDASFVSGSMGVRLSQTLTLAPRHILALFEGTGVGFGRLLPDQQHAIGGRFVLRGYEVDEALGRASVWSVVEYRWTALAALDAEFVRLAWLRSLQPVLFLGAGTVGEPADLFRPRRTYLEAGGGMRLHFDYGGVQQGVVAFDVGVPLSRTVLDWVPKCKGEGAAQRCFADLGVLLSFVQMY